MCIEYWAVSALVATVVLNQNETVVTEGNLTVNTTVDFCVVISDGRGGINREVIVNISAYEVTATGNILVT